MSACPLVDCHTHTSFSDGHASFEDNVRAAAAAGCRVMVSTDHLTLPASMDANCEVQVVEGDLTAHRLAFEDARKLAAQIAPELTFIYGFECDWYEGCEPLVERWSQGAVVRLGSVHWIGNPGDIAAGAAGTAGTKDVARPRCTRFALRLDRRRYQPACLGKPGGTRRVGALCRRLVPRLRKLTQL